MGQQPSSDEKVDVDKMWKSEMKLSKAERRKRYKCKDNYLEPSKIATWESKVDAEYNENPPRKLEDARNIERLKRKDEKLKEKEAKWKKEDEERKETEQKSVVQSEGKEEVKEEKKENEEKKDENEPPEDFRLKMKLRRRIQKRKELDEDINEASQLDVPLGKFEYNKEINSKIALIRADITTLEIDAVVNAANKSLLGGGGIDGAIHSAAGEDLYKECTTLGGADTGETKITRGYNLPAQFILHTVGPIGKNQPKLEECYLSCLKLVVDHKIKTVAFCGISTGIYGYPLGAATHVALYTIRKWLEDKNNRNKVDLIIMCTFLPKELVIYQKLMPIYFPPSGKNTDSVLEDYKKWSSSYDPTKDEVLEKEEKEFQEKQARRKAEKEERKKLEDKQKDEKKD